jgi:two-component system, response regulator
LPHSNSPPIRILYAEDSENDLYIFQIIQKKLLPSAQVIWIKNGQEIIDYLSHKKAYQLRKKAWGYHFVFLDINMPRVDGFEALLWIKTSSNEEIKKLPVAMISTSSHDADIERASKLGMKSGSYKESLNFMKDFILTQLNTAKIPFTHI